MAGVVVLDFSQFLAGPVAALRLADLGARVIKIERPVTGEIGRTLAFAGRWADEDTVSFHAMNRNKEAVVADLKDPGELEQVKSLVARADVLIHNFRPGVMERLGLDYESARALNPGLVYAAASGYGADGPWASRPGQDLLAQSVSGLTWVNGGDRPVTVGLSLADHLLSCHLAEGVTALLVRKLRTGHGGLIETSLLEGMLDLQSTVLTDHLNNPRTSSALDPTVTPHSLHRTADGYLAIAPSSLSNLMRALTNNSVSVPAADAGTGARASGGPADGRAGSESWVAERLLAGRTAYWLEVLGAAGIECAPLRTLDELIASPEFAAIEMTQTVERPPAEPGGESLRLTTTRSPIRIDGAVLHNQRAAPRLGAQGRLRDGADPLAERSGRGRQ
ncbi:CaiB/BaiF CoA-transferase family protein [Kribbella sp. VKM Ac-2571]|uniref:CaiB/BaiF CoA transferase family protein n=1 Tax=Kribbella sp. VKM Ac-2571 TaxID=2512222 RepID=UPI001EDD8D6F|nr:CoA transferase [Kribbella sp. VKM Ac-2571]